MLMWGDRLLDAKETGYHKWEASANGTAPAIDMIPKDIIICDWHYRKRKSYPSIPLFQKKGFRVLPASFNRVDGALALLEYARKHDTGGVLGHLCTTWCPASWVAQALVKEEGKKSNPRGVAAARVLRACMEKLREDRPGPRVKTKE